MSERVVVVADSGPLIALSRIGQLDLLPQLFGRDARSRRISVEVRDKTGEDPST